ncbi:MAG: S-layer homology domain-containing protein [Cyanobacteria bacterium P01_G01_bin.39]
MTNQSPPEPQNPIPERRKRPATGVTFDEMIGIIVAFSTIGTILFWSMGEKNTKLANNLGLGGSSNLLTSDQTTDTGLGFGNILAAGSDRDANINLDRDLEAENRRLLAKLEQSETELSPTELEGAASSQLNNRSLAFDSNAKLSPLAGVAASPRLRRSIFNNQNVAGRNSSANVPENVEEIEEETAVNPEESTTEPSGIVPVPPELETSQPDDTTPGDTEPSAVAPEIETEGTETDPEVELETNQPDDTAPGDTEPSAVAPEIETEGTETDPEVELETNQPDDTAPGDTEPSAAAPETAEMPEDVTPDYWAFPFVKQMRDQGLVPELGENQEFDPDALITRASMATLVSQAFQQQPATAQTKQFKDVTDSNTLARDINQAVRTGFMRGYSDDEFKPLQNIPRYQVLVTLATGLGLEPSQDAEQILQQFNDGSQMPDWAKQQVAAATEAGLVVNPPDADPNALIPERPATKAEVAAMIHQALVSQGKLEPLESEFIVQP